MDLLLNADAKDEDLVQFIRADQSCLSYVDEKGNNILQVVITKLPHNIKTIACLLELCPSLTKHYNDNDLTALHIAVKQSNFRAVDEIIRTNPRAMHYRDNGLGQYTPFQFAVRASEFEIVQRMVAIDPKTVEQLSTYKKSTLHLAKDFDIVKLLLTCKPTLIDAVDETGCTPLHLATDVDIVNLLLTCKPALIDAVDLFGFTPLHKHACGVKDAQLSTYQKTVQLLLQKKPTLLNMKNNDGLVAFDILWEHGTLNLVHAHLQCIDPDFQFYDTGQNKYGSTVLHVIAVCVMDPELIARVTHARKSELCIRNDRNETPLDVANIGKNTHAAMQYRLHCALDDTIESYHKHIPNDTSIDMWAVEQCSFLHTYLCSDLVILILSYLGLIHDRKKHNSKN